VVIEPTIPFARPAGTSLFLSSNPKIELELLPDTGTGMIQAAVVSGANKADRLGLLPEAGDDVVLSPFGKVEFYQRSRIEETPWTHVEILQEGTEAFE
jgi:hypothetical protein